MLLGAVPLLTGCRGGEEPAAEGSVTVKIWAHAGQESERDTLQRQIEEFNRAHPGLGAQLTLIPEGSYNAQVQAAAVAGELPDLLEIDGPFVYAYAWQGHLRPLDDLLPQSVRADLLPSIVSQGSYRGRLWSVGCFDSGLGVFADGSRLREASIRVPGLDRPWSRGEFGDTLARLARDDPDGRVLDLKLNYAGEWYTYALSPLLQSAGGDLIDRRTYRSAEGVLNGPGAVGAMRTIQSWITGGRVDPNIDGAAFVTRRVALALGGHWNYPQYSEAFGDDLLLLPLPDFGQGPRTGQGSWSWAVTANSRHPEAAVRFLIFLLQPRQVLAMTEANGAVPATRTAIDRSALYRPGGPLELFVVQLSEGVSVPRPRTPAYPVITAEFQKAFDRIRSGGDVQAVLDRAARAIDAEIEDNRYYPWVWGAEGTLE